MNQQFPVLNGIAPSWADVQFTQAIYGGPSLGLVDIKGLKYSTKVTRGEQKGVSGGRVIARTTGEVAYECTITFYRSGLLALHTALAALAPKRGNQAVIGSVGFDILVQHSPPNSDKVYTTKIKGCLLSGDSDDMKEGNEADTLDVEVSVVEIVKIINGVEVLYL